MASFFILFTPKTQNISIVLKNDPLTNKTYI